MLQARIEAQQSVDKLFTEGHLPFELSANKVEPIGLQEYVIRFNDNRLRSVIISWYEGLDFKDVCRAAVIETVKTNSGLLPYAMANRRV